LPVCDPFTSAGFFTWSKQPARKYCGIAQDQDIRTGAPDHKAEKNKI